jgi:pyruvate-formate lyase-activating enzyme
MKEALYYEKKENKKVKCVLCPKYCLISEGNTGICRVRKNIEGKLYALSYGKITGYHLDPIEKKPLYKYKKGSMVFSIGSYGCNLTCKFCQNYEIAHGNPRTLDLTIDDIIKKAKEAHIEITCLVIDDLNSNQDEILDMVQWIASIDKNIPFHLARYFPRYKMTKPPTKVDTLFNLHDIAKEYLNNVYLGNV